MLAIALVKYSPYDLCHAFLAAARPPVVSEGRLHLGCHQTRLVFPAVAGVPMSIVHQSKTTEQNTEVIIVRRKPVQMDIKILAIRTPARIYYNTKLGFQTANPLKHT